MKKAYLIIPFALCFFFTFIFISGLVFGNIIHQAQADEIMPFELIDSQDKFKLTIETDNQGKASAISYGYEFEN